MLFSLTEKVMNSEPLGILDKMKRQMMDIICCPVCKGDLALKVKSENDIEILAGFLTCGKCKFDYPIEDGIPNLLPPDMQKTM